jgi:hypothetical protein
VREFDDERRGDAGADEARNIKVGTPVFLAGFPEVVRCFHRVC